MQYIVSCPSMMLFLIFKDLLVKSIIQKGKGKAYRKKDQLRVPKKSKTNTTLYIDVVYHGCYCGG
jgi:hypothetical protein